MSDNSLQRGIRVIFEIIRTGRPVRRTSVSPAWWRWLLALLGVAAAAAAQWFLG
jgi:hypothetical protein